MAKRSICYRLAKTKAAVKLDYLWKFIRNGKRIGTHLQCSCLIPIHTVQFDIVTQSVRFIILKEKTPVLNETQPHKRNKYPRNYK